MTMKLVDHLYENFKRYFSAFADDVAEYEMYDDLELLITLHNGSQLLYDDTDPSIQYIPAPSKEERMTEKQWRYGFGMRLRKKMRMKGITQADLSEITGLTQSMISRYVTGKSIPSLYVIDKIARILECTTDDLLHFPRY